MSNQHKHPTISFRISDAERTQIEARILASGMMKKDYFVRSCIYNRICVVGKKENIYPLVQTVNALYLQLLEMQKAFTECCEHQTLNNLPTSVQTGAYALNIGSCWINRCKEMFELEKGQEYLRKWHLEDYVGIGCCILGYVEKTLPEKKILENRIIQG